MTEGDQPVAAHHEPVMLEQIMAYLAPALQHEGAIYVDGTLGLGGHARALLAACPQARLIGIDRDPAALAIAGRRLADFGERVELHQAVYHHLLEVLSEAGVGQVDAICLDLGLSSLQIDQAERGFAYAADAPLDMRMSSEGELTAAVIVNTWSASELAQILRWYADEKFAARIAARIVKARGEEPFRTSARLVQVVSDAIPVAARNRGGHPAKRTFQALRIAVNGELDSLRGVLPAALAALAPGGRLAILAYHSGEDRMVKQAFTQACSDRVPIGVPAVPQGYQADFRLLTRGAERPNPTEISQNPRSAPARLRVITRKQEATQ